MLHPDILKDIPEKPGVYIFKKDDKPLYIGKATSLKKRISSYFQRKDKPFLIEKSDKLEWIITLSEEESLLLENNLIKSLKPKYNIRLKDDRQYPYLLLTDEEYPALLMERRRNQKGIYIGPFAHSHDLKTFRNMVEEIFGIRTCRKMRKTGCMLYQINRCIAPCINKNKEEYRENVEKFKDFLKGKRKEVLNLIEKRIKEFADKEMFEYAQKLKEQYNSINQLEISGTHYHYRNSEDVIGVSRSDEGISLVIIMVRNHHIKDIVTYYFKGKENIIEGTEKILFSYYKDQIILPSMILIPEVLKEMTVEWIKNRGIEIQFPKSGKSLRLVKMAEENALHYLSLQEKIPSVLVELQKFLSLPNPPTRIAITDMSHFSGDVPTGVVVFFEKGKPKKDNYRKFYIKEAKGGDDYAMMEETIIRWINQKIETDLFIVDGGKGQLNTVKKIFEENNINIPLISIAKPNDDIITEKGKISLPDYNPIKKLLQRMRNEAHRFAISSTRKRMRKRIKEE